MVGAANHLNTMPYVIPISTRPAALRVTGVFTHTPEGFEAKDPTTGQDSQPPGPDSEMLRVTVQLLASVTVTR